MLGVGAGVVVAGPVLAACAPSTSAPSTNTGGDDPLKDDGVKDFHLTSWSANEAVTKDVLQSAIDKFTAASGGKVTVASYPYNDYLNQVLLQVQGGQTTGVVQLDVAWLATLAATGKLVDLTSVASGVDYAPAALTLGQVKGTQYGLPWTTAGIGLIGNKEILSRAGVTTAPATIADFENALNAVKSLGDGIVPWAGMTKVDQLKDIIPWLWEFGSPIVDDSGKIVIGDDGSVEALTWYKKLYDQKLIAPDVNRVDARALMSQGKAAYYEDAIGGRAAVTTASADKQLGAKLVPIGRPVKAAGDKPRHLAWGHVLVVLGGAGAASAANFAKTVTSDPAYTSPWFAKAGLPPSTTAGLADPAVTGDAFASEFAKQIGANATPSPFWIFPQFAQMEKVLAEEVQGALIGKKQPKEALTSAGERMNALI
jgi:multiple sugar transport system substrate-binding protein